MNPSGPYQPQQPLPPTQPQLPAQPSQEYGPLPSLNQAPTSSPQPQGYVTQPMPAPQAAPQVDYTSVPNEQKPEEYAIDYLNKIAPQEQKTVNRFAIFGLIGALLFSIIFAVVLLGNSGVPNTDSQLIAVDERINTLQTITTAQQTQLNENDISEANAALSSSLTSMSTTMQGLLKVRTLKDNNKVKMTAEASYLANLNKTLNDAYQRGILDRTYTTQMTYELTLLHNMFTRLKSSSKDSDIDTFCDTGIANLDAVLKAYSNFNATKS